MYIAPYQSEVFGNLLRAGRLFFESEWQKLPIRPRFHQLLAGSTGTGKSRLVQCLAEKLDVPILSISLTSWVVLGATGRGCSQTWPTICSFIKDAERGIIFIDEIDKLTEPERSAWTQSLIVEAFGLLDGRIPAGVDSKKQEIDEVAEMPEKTRIELSRKLQTNFFIVAAGAFQSLWDIGARTPIGFSPSASPRHATKLDITGYIPPELANRFRSQVLVLPPLDLGDYLMLVQTTSDTLPSKIRPEFLRIAWKRIGEAIRKKLGFRFIEEVLLDALQAGVDVPKRKRSAKLHQRLSTPTTA